MFQHNKSKLIGVVLAGGLSSRMGTDKAMLCIQGEPLLFRARRILLEAGCEEVVLSGAPRSNWGGQSIADFMPHTGPAGGIISCVDTLSNMHKNEVQLVFVAVDTPLLTSALIHDLINASEHRNAGIYEHNPLPLAINANDKTRRSLQQSEAWLREGKSVSIRSLIKDLDLICITPSQNHVQQLSNINTPTEWERLQDELAH